MGIITGGGCMRLWYSGTNLQTARRHVQKTVTYFPAFVNKSCKM
jgi:hypothetical protein